MRITFLVALFWMLMFSVPAQITSDTSYNSSVALAKLENSGYKYYTFDWFLSQCLIYNTDHSVWKSIPLIIPTDQYLYSIQYLSETLFNPDSKVELVYTYYSYDTLKLYYTYTTRIINEEGTELLLVPGASYVNVFDTDTLKTKMLVYVYDYSVSPYTVKTQVFSLPGAPAPNGQENLFPGLSNGVPYPNPAKLELTIPYKLPEGTRDGRIEITDLSGRIIRTFRIDDTFRDLRMDVSGYSRGTYLYGIFAGSRIAGKGKFIVD